MSQHESGCTTSIFEVEPRIHIQVEAGREFVRVLRGQGEKKKLAQAVPVAILGSAVFREPAIRRRAADNQPQ